MKTKIGTILDDGLVRRARAVAAREGKGLNEGARTRAMPAMGDVVAGRAARCRRWRWPSRTSRAGSSSQPPAYLANAAASGECELFYWRERNEEVDFVVRAARTVVALEVKSGRRHEAPVGLASFTNAFKPARTLLVGGDGIPVGNFLLRPVEEWRGR